MIKYSGIVLSGILASILVGCEKEGKIEPELPNLGLESRSLDDFKSIWLNHEYGKAIAASLSPFNSISATPVDLMISDSSILSWNYHEGVSLVYDRISGDTLFLRCTENEEYSIYVVLKSDNALLCHNCVRESTITLMRMNDEKETKEPDNQIKGYPDYFRQQYTKGRWIIKDVRSGNEISGIFDDVLKMNELEEFSDYEFVFDYADDIPQMDLIEFRGSLKDPKLMNYKMFGDSILVYDIVPESRSEGDSAFKIYGANSKIGDLHFVLRRL